MRYYNHVWPCASERLVCSVIKSASLLLVLTINVVLLSVLHTNVPIAMGYRAGKRCGGGEGASGIRLYNAKNFHTSVKPRMRMVSLM